MPHRRRLFRTLVKHAKYYRWRLTRMPKETLRGVIRGSVYRFRIFFPGSTRRSLNRRIERLLALYELRYGKDTFAKEIRANVDIPLARTNWLLGGFVHWRSRITNCPSGSPTTREVE